MKQEYFPGFTFTQPNYSGDESTDSPMRENFEIRLILVEMDYLSGRLVETLSLDDLLRDDDMFQDQDISLEEDQPVRSVTEILPDFKRTLREVGQDIRYRFTMRNRELLLVPREELKPKTEEEAQRLVEKYGEYMREGSGGGCTYLKRGKYRLRVAMDDGGVLAKSTAVELAAHEFGHSLSRFLESVTFEELKAFAFASLCQQFYNGESYYMKARTDLHPDRPHDVARHYLGELLRSGVPEGAILSHLVGRRLGRFGSADYLKFI